LEALRREKFRAEGDLKVLDLKLIVLQKELDLLKEFEKEDIALADKLQSKRAEKAEFTARIEDFQSKLKSKTKEMDSLTDSTQTLDRQLESVTREIPAIAAEVLKKIYSKNIKRTKVKFKAVSSHKILRKKQRKISITIAMERWKMNHLIMIWRKRMRKLKKTPSQLIVMKISLVWYCFNLTNC
jgi:chromosome segregation ATPase